MTSKLRRITNELADEFRRHFERDPKKDDPMFLGKYLMSDEDLERETVRAMTAAKADPAHIYAYKKTGYLIVGDNLDRYTGAAIKEWDNAIDEFDRSEASDQGGVEERAFDEILESLVREFESFIFLLGLAHDKFFNTSLLRPFNESGGILSSEGYQALCLSRVHRTLRSVRELNAQRMSDDVLKLARSIYESYLHISFVRTNPDSLISLVGAPIGLRNGTYAYKKRKDGSEDKRIVLELSSGREFPAHISAFKMAEATGLVEDIAFFDFFYRRTSEFLHPSVFALDSYISTRGLDPVKPHMYEEAIIFTTCVTAMSVECLSGMTQCPKSLIRDCKIVVKRVRGKLLRLLAQLDEWQRRMGAELSEIELLRARCARLQENKTWSS
jgi:hypothetical protein